jgi:DNA-binding IclR family transcriptional regulator/sugar lactone lactonase YvrE
MATKPADGTASLDKALDVLDAVGSAPSGLSQAELAAQLALPRTTLYRLLGTLVARGLLRRDPLRRVYGLGLRCFEYARAAYAMPDLVAAAGAELRALRDMTGETVYLAARDGHDVVALERCESLHSQRSNSALGQRKPLSCTSQGKAILAALPEAEREALVRELPMTPVTPRSLTERRRLLAELRVTATRGWSMDDEEMVLGVRCCGAAIIDSSGAVRGSISVAGPLYRLTMERIELLGPEVAEAARRVGAQLSAAPGPARAAAGEPEPVRGGWAFEGGAPFWHGDAAALFWADRLAPAVHRASSEADLLLARTEAPIQQLLPHAGGLLLQCADEWRLVGFDGQPQLDAPALPRRRLSAACAAPDGRLWVCGPDADGDHDGAHDTLRWWVRPLAGEQPGWRLPEPVTAMSWDEGGRALYLVTADTGTLWAAQPGSPTLRRLATVPKGSGRLSGLALDRDGGLWSALRGGWGVVRFEADGALDRMVALPVPCPTGLAFGGEQLRTLFVTTARDAVSREALDAAPLSGRLFALGAGVAGQAVPLAA